MGQILPFPVTSSSAIDEAWENYASLVRAYHESPGLRADRQHVEAMWKAYQAFGALFCAREKP